MPREGFLNGSVDKEFSCSAGDTGDVSSVLGLGRSPGGEKKAAHSSVFA